MGKRRTNAPHRDRYAGNDSESDEPEEEYIEPEPLQADQLASIKTRKKLIAKRRGASTTTTPSLGVFGALSSKGSGEEDSDKPSIFSGFKGFSAFKSSAEPAKPASTGSMFATTPSSTFSFAPKTSVTTAPKTDLFGSNNNKTTTQGDLFGKTMVNGDTVTTPKEPTKTSEMTSEPVESSNNLNETELQFINELNVVYEKFYGKNKKTLNLPEAVLNQAAKPDEKPEDSLRRKYGMILAELNRKCATWISKHVEEDPMIVLTPIFVDYFNYMLLMEKSFFPLTNTFKSKSSPAFGNLNGKASSNGGGSDSAVTATPVLATSASSNIVFNKNVNGHKEETLKFNGLDSITNQADKENEEAEKDKKLSDSSKSFANLVKAQMNPIPFADTSVTTAFASTKSTPTPKLAEKDSTTTTPNTQTSLFKFGSAPPSKPIVDTKDSPAEKKSETDFASSFKSGPTPDLNKTASTFKFGALSDTTKASTEPATTLFGKSTEASSSSLFGKPNSASPSLFGKPTESTTPSLFGKPTESTTPSSLFGKPATESTKTSIFDKPGDTASPASIFGKPTTTEKQAEKPAEEAEEKKASGPSFSSLMNASQPGGGFKGFAGFGAGATGASTFGSGTGAATGEPAKPFFSFAGAATTGAKPGGLFGSTGSTGSSLFGSGSTFPAATNAGNGQQEEEEEYVPPKPETSDVKEEGAVYEKRMKLYYYSEKESKFVDRGIGHLYLKPINEGQSTQLIIRADNKLANILLNVKLGKALPISKISAKDVSFLCIPNPPIPNVESMCKFLFKVKTEEDAVELVDKLNEFKR